MDKQMCTLEIESFGYTMSDLKFRWEDGPKTVQASEQFPSIQKIFYSGNLSHIYDSSNVLLTQSIIFKNILCIVLGTHIHSLASIL